MAFPATRNFDYYRGDTYEFDVVLKNSDNSDFDLASYESVAFTIGTKRGTGGTQTSCLATKVLPSTVKCTITSTTGRGLAAGQYYYDVQITDTGTTPSTINTVLTGIINVVDDVTGAV